jgi:hypothetical protein
MSFSRRISFLPGTFHPEAFSIPTPMKTFLRLLSFLALGFVSLHAAEDKSIADVRAADEERMAATKSGDRARMDAIFSNELYYAHSSGKIDNKASYIESIASKATVYESFDPKQRDFKLVAPGVVMMTTHLIIKVKSNGTSSDNDLNAIAVYREENGKWRFYAWQSCKNPPATPAAAK